MLVLYLLLSLYLDVHLYRNYTKTVISRGRNEYSPIFTSPSANNRYSYMAFSRYGTPIHWLVYGHMTPNNETVDGQMPLVGNIAKTMTSNGNNPREMLIAVARDHSVQLNLV